MFKDELIIIRHARSDNNIAQTDEPDCGITEFGKRQAENVGKFLASHLELAGFACYTSPFLRCLQTASPIGSAIGKHFTVFSLFREYINHNDREVFIKNHYGNKELKSINWNGFPEQGVTFVDEFNETFLDRMLAAHEALPNRSIVVTHGLPALMLLNIAKDPTINHIPLWDHSIDNCSITRIVKGKVVWHGRNLYHEIDGDPIDTLKIHRATDKIH